MPNIDLYLQGTLSHNVPQEVLALHNAEACLANTGKHIFICPVDGYQASRIIEMIGAIVEDAEAQLGFAGFWKGIEHRRVKGTGRNHCE